MRFLSILAFAALAAAGPDDARRLEPGHAPTPYTAAQIRAACPEGRVVTYLVEQSGYPRVRQIMRFTRGDADGTDYEISKLGPDAKPMGTPSVKHATWKELQRHASYPAAATKVTEETVEVPGGKFACWLYTVTSDNAVRKFWFAKDLPGPPVKVVAVAGNRAFSMALESNRPFDFTLWFGPQAVEAGAEAPAVEIELKVTEGSDLKPETVTTLFDGKVRDFVAYEPGADVRYVVAETGSDVEGAVRVTKGPLRGALIHLRGRKSVYALPRGLQIPAAALEFEVVALKKSG